MSTRFSPTALESIVRPFALENLLPAPTQLPVRVPEGEVLCELGGSGGTSVSMSFDGAGFYTVNQSNKFKESGRSSTLTKVENPDDPSQFVEFCRADSIRLSPKDVQKDPPKTSSYDTSGGYHNFGDQNLAGRKREYSFEYPTEPSCKSPGEPPKGGNC